jgi:hypothetical protein
MHLDQLISKDWHKDLSWSQAHGGDFTADREREGGSEAHQGRRGKEAE